MSHMSESSSFLENFGVPEDLGYTSHSSDMRENSYFNPSGKDIYNKRKTFQKKASLKEDVSEYHVEHLLEEEIDKREGTPLEDIVRKMKILDSKKKIWSQDMYLRVDSNTIKFVDPVNEDVLDTFAIQSVQIAKAMKSAEESKSKTLLGLMVKIPDQKKFEIHLFFCKDIPANMIAADVNSALADSKIKKESRKSRAETIRKNREEIAKIHKEVDVQRQVQQIEEKSNEELLERSFSPRDSIALSEETPEVQAYNVNRQVLILNHILDDIEHFCDTVNECQKAAKELEMRKANDTTKSKKSSKKGSKKGSKKIKEGSTKRGVGLLQLRARLPPKDAYKEILQKFKYTFNILTKLKPHLENPNAVELVHFLFKPLESVLTTCNHGDLPCLIDSPLLSLVTIQFLDNCCTSHENRVRESLGKYWNLPKSEFPPDMFFRPYVPRFRSGWQPPPLYRHSNREMNQAELDDVINQQIRENELEKMRMADAQIPLPPPSLERSITPPLSPEVFYTKINKNNNLFDDRNTQNPLYEGDSRRSSLQDGRKLAGPNEYKDFVRRHVHRNEQVNHVPRPPQIRKLCRAMHDFEARNRHELSVNKDDLLDVLDDSKKWWKVANNYGQEGLVPAALMLMISTGDNSLSPPVDVSTKSPPPKTPPPPVVLPPPVIKSPPRNNDLNSQLQQNQRAKLKPIMKRPSQRSVSPKGNPKLSSSIPNQKISDTGKRNIKYLQEELQQRVEAQKLRNFQIVKRDVKSNTIQLSGDSKPEDVKKWLQYHQFSPNTCNTIGQLNGAQLFRLTKEDLIKVCNTEASRVYSNLLLQKSSHKASGDKQLEEKLRRRREGLTKLGIH